MEITFSCSVDDYVAYYTWHRYPRGKDFAYWWARFWSAAGATPLPLLLALLTRNYPQNQSIWQVSAVFAGFMFLLVFISFSGEAALETWARNAYRGREGYGQFGKKTLRLQDKYLSSITELGESTTDYYALTKIVETPSHVFILQGPSAHIVPRANVEESALNAFLPQLKNLIDVAAAAHPPAPVDAPAQADLPTDWWAIAAFFVAAILLVAGGVSFIGVNESSETTACLCNGDISLCSARVYCKIQAVFRGLIAASIFLGLPLLGFSIYRFFFKRKNQRNRGT